MVPSKKKAWRSRSKRIGKAGKAAAKTRGIAFGSVVIDSHPDKVNSAVVRHNVEVGRAALARAGKALVAPGVKLGMARNIPLFHIDPEHPGVLIRELDGRRERVKLENGQFIKTE